MRKPVNQLDVAERHSLFKECATRIAILMLDYVKRHNRRPHSIAVSKDIYDIFDSMQGVSLKGYFAPYRDLQKLRLRFMDMPLMTVVKVSPEYIWML